MTKLSELCSKLVELKDKKKRLENEVTQTNKDIAKYNEIISDRMMEEDLKTIRTDRGTFSVHLKEFYRIPPDIKSDILELIDAHEEGMVTPGINTNTLNAWCRRQVKENGSLPDWLKGKLEIYDKYEVGVRRK